MRDLTIGLDAGSNSNFGRLLFDFRIAQKEGKTAPNLLFFLIERRKEKKRKVQQQKEIDNFCNQ